MVSNETPTAPATPTAAALRNALARVRDAQRADPSLCPHDCCLHVQLAEHLTDLQRS